MPDALINPGKDPAPKTGATIIAARPTRRYRAAAFQAYVLGASAVFITLAIVAHTVAYFPIDLTITHVVQSYHGAFFDRLMYGVSWVGFMPQVDVLLVLAVAALFIAGLRWESAAAFFAGCAFGVGTVVKLAVYRPRPSADLVHVFGQLPSSGFPSGHVLEFTAFVGFLFFLTYTLLKPSWGRTSLLVASALFILLMGLSRIYQGQHWFSDVMGAYLLGSLWLALTIRLYRWGKLRFFTRQPVAPEIPAAPVGSAARASTGT